MKSESDPAPTQQHGRAGRDLPAAIAVGVTLVSVVVASLYFTKDAFGYVVAAALSIALFELARALRSANITISVLPVLVGGVAMQATAYYEGMDVASTVFGVTALVVLVERLRRGAEGYVRDVTGSVFVLTYLFFMGTFVMRILAADDGAWLIVAFIACTVASDIGGYAAGVLFGKHPMAPTISPKKSWEGFAGSLVTGMLMGLVIVVLALDAAWWIGILLGAACVVMATLGDLCESLIKRDLGIKDMGDLLPGHGGLMDRLDSLIAVAPVAFLVTATLL